MATVTVRVPTALRACTGGEPVVSLEVSDGLTVRDALDRLAVEHPELERRVRDEQRRVRRHVNLFVGADNVRDLSGLATELHGDTELTLLPAVSGG